MARVYSINDTNVFLLTGFCRILNDFPSISSCTLPKHLFCQVKKRESAGKGAIHAVLLHDWSLGHKKQPIAFTPRIFMQ